MNKPTQAKNPVFVYGTLRKGEPPFYWIKAELYSLGPYPAIKNVNDTDSWVKGEVLWVNDKQLRRFDQIEGVVSGHYIRKRTPVWEVKDGLVVVVAWVYEYGTPEKLHESMKCGEDWQGSIGMWTY